MNNPYDNLSICLLWAAVYTECHKTKNTNTHKIYSVPNSFVRLRLKAQAKKLLGSEAENGVANKYIKRRV